jgi:hypothetical protein
MNQRVSREGRVPVQTGQRKCNTAPGCVLCIEHGRRIWAHWTLNRGHFICRIKSVHRPEETARQNISVPCRKGDCILACLPGLLHHVATAAARPGLQNDWDPMFEKLHVHAMMLFPFLQVERTRASSSSSPSSCFLCGKGPPMAPFFSRDPRIVLLFLCLWFLYFVFCFTFFPCQLSLASACSSDLRSLGLDMLPPVTVGVVLLWSALLQNLGPHLNFMCNNNS